MMRDAILHASGEAKHEADRAAAALTTQAALCTTAALQALTVQLGVLSWDDDGCCSFFFFSYSPPRRWI